MSGNSQLPDAIFQVSLIKFCLPHLFENVVLNTPQANLNIVHTCYTQKKKKDHRKTKTKNLITTYLQRARATNGEVPCQNCET